MRLRRSLVVSALMLLLAVTAALREEEKKEPQGDAKWGTITGRITWGGKKLPEARRLNVMQECAMPVFDESWVVNPKNKGLKNTFVWLAVKDPKAKGPAAIPPIHPNLQKLADPIVAMDIPACMFVPHALAMRQGQDLVITNRSTIAHNAKYTGNLNVPGNAGAGALLPPGPQKKIQGLAADRLPVMIECNIHPWMKAWVRVFNHPYYAVTDADGVFEIRGAPTGKYRVMIWHGTGGWLGGAAGRDGRAVKVKASTDLGDIAYPPPE